MSLYICPTCGAWSDISLAQVFNQLFQPMSRVFARNLAESHGFTVSGPVEEEEGWFCPLNREHGHMRQISPDDRLFIKPAIVEPEQGAGQGEESTISSPEGASLAQQKPPFPGSGRYPCLVSTLQYTGEKKHRHWPK